MNHWATVLDSIQAGIEGDREKCRAYAELWLEKLRHDGEMRIAQSLQRILEGHKGQIIYLAALTGAGKPPKEDTMLLQPDGIQWVTLHSSKIHAARIDYHLWEGTTLCGRKAGPEYTLDT